VGVTLLFLALPSQGQEIHSKHCLLGCPSGGPPSNDLIVRDIYILSSNDSTKFADWAAYRVTIETIGSTKPRTWKADPLLSDGETLEPEDYRGAHQELEVDHGHEVPLASFTATPDWEETNYLSNITPQKSDLNQGAWARLEDAERDLARDSNIPGVYVMTGPLYEREMPRLPNADEEHRVPSGYWKIIAIAGQQNVQAAAFVFDQDTPKSSDFCSHLSTIRDIENRIHLDFFHKLDRAEQDALETGRPILAPVLGCP
jgi:endonuclease G